MENYEKKYKEALENAGEIIRNKDASSVWKDWLRNIFPELKESEGEKIRKSLIHLVHLYGGEFEMIDANTSVERAIAWLEKQSEQIDIANKEYWRGYREGKNEILDKYAEIEKQGEQKPANSAKTCKDEQKPIKWDEYDEMYVAALITMVKNHCTTDDKLKNELIGWLVSLKTSIK